MVNRVFQRNTPTERALYEYQPYIYLFISLITITKVPDNFVAVLSAYMLGYAAAQILIWRFNYRTE